MQLSRPLLLLGLAALSGLLLFLSNYPVHLWPLQLLALVPLLVGLLAVCRSGKWAALAGLATGSCLMVPLAVVLEFPLLMAVGLGLYLILLWVLLSVGLYRVLQGPALRASCAAGAIAVLVEWVDFHLVPVWGTAQSFARVWSAAPWAIQLLDLAGLLGLIFVLVSGQTLVAQLLVRRQEWRSIGLALALLVGATLAYNLAAWPRRPVGTLRVAAMGWTAAHLPVGAQDNPRAVLDELYRPLFAEAARRGARLVVSPEVGFWLSEAERQPLLAELGALARRQQVALAVGYFDRGRQDNRVAFFDAGGRLHGEYVKTRLIPFVEHYRAGDGTLLVAKLVGASVGGLICQDDNFTDLARAYGRRGAQLLAIPTNDWRQVKAYHLENSILRAVENRYGLVRAASNGVSAIVAPSSEVLARADHFVVGPQVIVADLPLLNRASLYSYAGEWLALACLLGLVVGWLRRRRVSPQREG